METTSNFKLVVEGISAMDIHTLQQCLSEEYSYQNTTKAVFLAALEKVFNEYKTDGDTVLQARTGNCSGTGCDNCGKGGYSFWGSITRNSLNLIITVDNHNTITDMYECRNFTTDAQEQIELDWFRIYILADERLDFNKTPEYWTKYNGAMAAYDELMITRPALLDYNTMDYWLSKHEFTYKRMGERWEQAGMKWQSFTDLYYQLNLLRYYIQNHGTTIATANHARPPAHDEKQQLLWMLEYETLLHEAPFYFRELERHGDDYYSEQHDLLFTDKTFNEVFYFISTARTLHTQLLAKYSTYTYDEAAEASCHPQYDYNTNLAYSLKFHLERRVELDRLGVKVGFYLEEE